jgi:YD repeat-containing protein
MKNLLLLSFVLAALLIVSCKKGNSSGNSGSNSSYLSSVTVVTPQKVVIDSFAYDSSHRLASFIQTTFDTTSGSPVTGSWSAVFALSAGSSAPPQTYTNNLTGVTETHQLIYDGQGRIIKDTSLGGSGWVIYFSYPNSNINITALYDGTVANSIADTMTISNGNIGTAQYYAPNNFGTADSLEGVLKFGFSSISNPAYHATLTGSIGPLMQILAFSGFGGGLDAISQKAFNSEDVVLSDGVPPNTTIPFTLTTDSQGRLSTQSAGFGGVGITITYRYY